MRLSPLSIACMLALTATPALSQANPARLFVLSDTDMVPTVYETGELGPVDPNRDTLSVISLPTNPSRPPVAVEVSNSTYGPPGALDISTDGRFAFIAETFGLRPGEPRGSTSCPEAIPFGLSNSAIGQPSSTAWR